MVLCGRSNLLAKYKLTGSELAILFIILSHYNKKTGIAFPSQDRVVEISGFSSRTVVRSISGLLDKDIIAKFKEQGRRNNTYQLSESFLTKISKKRAGHFIDLDD